MGSFWYLAGLLAFDDDVSLGRDEGKSVIMRHTCSSLSNSTFFLLQLIPVKSKIAGDCNSTCIYTLADKI